MPTMKFTYAGLACMTFVVLVVFVRGGNDWSGVLGRLFYVVMIGGTVLALLGAVLAILDRHLAGWKRALAIFVGFGTLVAALMLMLVVIFVVSKLS
jgi:hypothetical protein